MVRFRGYRNEITLISVSIWFSPYILIKEKINVLNIKKISYYANGHLLNPKTYS